MDPKEQLSYLRSPKAVRDQCGRLYELASAGRLKHFSLHEEKLPDTSRYVLDVIKAEYPKLDIPYHSRWRHFDSGRLAALAASLQPLPPEDQARIKIELAVVSVLLDAGAGGWSYKDKTGKSYSRSEGLALASFDMFLDGGFASDPETPLQADVVGLKALDRRALSTYFQVGPGNQLPGFDGRLGLLHKLASAVQTQKRIFGDIAPRLGNLFDYLASHAGNGKLPARKIFTTVLEGLGSIWPGRLSLAGSNLGDVWRHSALPQGDIGAGLVPFHKLSQWLTYSLVEPLEEAGLEIGGLDELTGLAEYRNGGLFLDFEVIKPKTPTLLQAPLKPDSEAVIEWRGLTVCLLDRVAAEVRKGLGLSALELPLAKVLQGGTWSAGRRIAAERRPGGGPPIQLASDGTVF